MMNLTHVLFMWTVVGQQCFCLRGAIGITSSWSTIVSCAETHLDNVFFNHLFSLLSPFNPFVFPKFSALFRFVVLLIKPVDYCLFFITYTYIRDIFIFLNKIPAGKTILLLQLWSSPALTPMFMKCTHQQTAKLPRLSFNMVMHSQIPGPQPALLNGNSWVRPRESSILSSSLSESDVHWNDSYYCPHPLCPSEICFCLCNIVFCATGFS